MKNKKSKVVFKTYTPQQISLLPHSYDELIPQEHLVRMLNNVIDKMNIDPLVAEYKGGGKHLAIIQRCFLKLLFMPIARKFIHHAE